MPLIHLTDRHLIRVLATETRRADTTPVQLARSHVALGRRLAEEVVERLVLAPCDIQHPQGLRSGWQVADEHRIGLLPFMRAGLYVAEGVRDVFQRAPVLHLSPSRDSGLSERDRAACEGLELRAAVLIDSVVNTGTSLEPVLRQITATVPAVFVVSLVAPATTARRLEQDWPEVTFVFARLSDNEYVGRGATDTGNRLFGTLTATGGTP